MEKALSNPYILRHLLRYLPTADLLRCSLVNKQWSFEARSLIRDCRKCFARVDDSNSASTLSALNEDLRRICNEGRPVPYNGLYMNICLIHGQPEVCRESEWNLAFIEDEWPLKYLKIRWERFNKRLSYCPCARTIPTLLSKHSQILEELVFVDIPGHPSRLFVSAFDCLFRGDDEDNNDDGPMSSDEEDVVDDGALSSDEEDVKDDGSSPFRNLLFPKLRKVKIINGENINYGSKFMQHLLHVGAPTLQELDCPTQLHNLFTVGQGSDLIPEGKLKLVKRCEMKMFPCETIVSTFLRARPELRQLTVICSELYVNPYDVIELLRQSSDTLEVFRCSVDLLASIQGQIPVLPNVKDLTLYLVPISENRNYRSLISSIDFRRLFPLSGRLDFGLKFSMLWSNFGPWESNDILDSTDRGATAIRRLTIHANSIPSGRLAEAVSHLTDIFPSVEALSFDFFNARLLDSCSWAGWRHLRSVHFRLYPDDDFHTWNFDASFCGIHSEEVVELRQWDDDDLRQVNIVPCLPPLNYFKDLEILSIELWSYQKLSAVQFAHLPQLISEVSKFLVFRHMPKLKVTFTSNSTLIFEKNLDHYYQITTPEISRESAENLVASSAARCQIL